MKRFCNKHKGKRCFVIGNAPNLVLTDPMLAKNDVTLGCNGIWQHPIAKHLTYYFCGDPNQWKYMRDEINTYKGPWKILPARHKRWIKVDGRTALYYSIKERSGTRPGRFETNLKKGIVVKNGTVLYEMLQFAVWLGCNPIYIIGVHGSQGGHWIADAQYYKGRLAAINPKTELSIMHDDFRIAQIHLERLGVQVFNASAGGTVHWFPRAKYKKLFRR